MNDLNNDVLNFIKAHNNCEMVLLTANYYFIAQSVAELFPTMQSLSTQLEIKRGKLTGIIKGEIPYGREKTSVLDEFKKYKNYSKIIGVGDSKSDIYFLRNLDEGWVVNYNSKNNSTTFDRIS